MQKTIVVSERNIGKKSNLNRDISNIELILLVIHELSKEVSVNPEVQCVYQEKSIWVLFTDSCFECDSIIGEYGEFIALVSGKFPVTINGIIDNFEIGEIKVFFEGENLKLIKSNVTGKNFEILSDLCIKITGENDDELELLSEVLSNIKYNQSCIAIRRKWDNYFCDDKSDINKFTKYNYVEFDEVENDEEYLNSLAIPQMTELWMDFLSNYHTAVEFEILYRNFINKKIKKIFEWELSLRIALSKLGISIYYSEDILKIVDKEGKDIHYNFESFSCAEKCLLKILFPITIKTI